MALRVLLADESVTIKKVFQLALQDFAVEVNSVTVGVDVLNVALKYKPDIVFADVLLQKKNGYDVCHEIKTNPELSSTPVVLIWSGFMELDDAKYKSSGANAHLEKPFDTQRLRQIIQTLVAKTKSQKLSSYLTFPKLPDFDDSPTTNHIPPPPKSAIPNLGGGFEPTFNPDLGHSSQNMATPNDEPGSHEPSGWSMDQFAEPLPEIPEVELSLVEPTLTPTEDEEDFMPLNLVSEPPKRPTPAAPLKPATRQAAPPQESTNEDPVEEDAQWVQKTLSRYKLDPAKRSDAPAKVSYKIPEEKIDPDTFISNTWSRPLADKKAVEKQEPRSGRTAKLTPPPLPPEADQNEEVFELELHNEPATHTGINSAMPSTSSRPAAAIEGVPQLSEQQLEALIRAQSKEVIEKVVWQIVPEIATRIIERELERLLSERNQK